VDNFLLDNTRADACAVHHSLLL